jgi:hypothetical protein
MIERDIPLYAAYYGVSIEQARIDVEGEYGQTLTDADAFHERVEHFEG